MATKQQKLSSEVLDNLIRIYLTRHYELPSFKAHALFNCNPTIAIGGVAFALLLVRFVV